MIPAVKAKLLEGKRGLIVGIANDQSIAWGCAKAFRAFGAELAVTYLNDKAKKYVEPLARELEAPIMMPLDVQHAGPDGGGVRSHHQGLGQPRFRACIPSPFRQRMRLQGRVVDVSQRRLSHDHGRVLLDLHPHGASGRTVDAEGRDAFHDDATTAVRWS